MSEQALSDSFRWKDYVLFNGGNIDEIWNKTYYTQSRRILYILGSGFDIRMTNGLSILLRNCPDADITCLLIDFEKSGLSHHNIHEKANEQNRLLLNSMLPSNRISIKTIRIYADTNENHTERQYIGDESVVAEIFKAWEEIEPFSDIYLDVSSLSRGIYISLSGKILSILDQPQPASRLRRINFFIVATENAAMDALIKEEGLVGRPQFLRGFSLTFSPFETVKPLLWLPMLGEDKQTYLQATYEELKGKKQKLEICPVLPFPSRDPRRSDNLFAGHHHALFDELTVDFNNVIYVPEQNPYEVYLGLVRTIVRFNRSMKLLGGCRVAISPFSSKLLSVGAMLASYELYKFRKSDKIDVGVITTVSESYGKLDQSLLIDLHKDSELFVIWAAGDPYPIVDNLTL